MNKPLRVVFAGTPDFAVASLAALFDSDIELLWVYTQPDAVAGRGQKYRPSAVKEFAQKNNILIKQPSKLGAVEADALRQAGADILVVVAYGQIVPQKVLDAPRLGCINVHGSILPRWRGAAPIQRAVLAGDSEFGISVMQMDAGLDTGPVYKIAALEGPCLDMTSGELSVALSNLGAQTLKEVLLALDKYDLKPQPDEGVCYAAKIKKAEACINWSSPADAICAHVRAFNPWPMAYCYLGQSRIRIACVTLKSAAVTNEAPGTVIGIERRGVLVACGAGVVCVTRLQFPGKKMQDLSLFTAKLPITVGMLFTGSAV